MKHLKQSQVLSPEGITGFGLTKITSQRTLRASTELLTYYRALVTPAHLQPRFLFFSFLLHRLIFRGTRCTRIHAQQRSLKYQPLNQFCSPPPSKTTKITVPGGAQALPLPTLCFSWRTSLCSPRAVVQLSQFHLMVLETLWLSFLPSSQLWE